MPSYDPESEYEYEYGWRDAFSEWPITLRALWCATFLVIAGLPPAVILLTWRRI